jgi:hypothetical protein
MSGKLFDKTGPIRAFLAPTVQNSIIQEIHDIYPDLVCVPIGSVGKRNDNEYNGDIDVAIKCKDVETLRSIIETVFDYIEDTIVTESLYIVSIKYPYQLGEEPIQFVQVDFMNIWDEDYTRFRYYCPDYRKNESRYKVGQKIMFATMLLNHTQDKHDGLEDGCLSKFDFRPTALFRYWTNPKDDLLHEQYITTDVDKIVNMCFKDGDRNHFNSIETLWEAIHTDNFKYPEEVKSIEHNFFVNCWRKGWENIVPEDFNIQYWSNEEIWESINKQAKINKINNIFCKLANMENK